MVVAPALDAHSNHGLGCRTCWPKHGNRGQGFVIELGDQEGFLGPNFLPYLPDLDSLAYLTRHCFAIIDPPFQLNLGIGCRGKGCPAVSNARHGSTRCGKSGLFCHSERSEESLFDLNLGKERFLGAQRASE